MANEEKILSMLDTIAEQVKYLTENMATKDELRSFKEQTNHRFNQIDERFAKVDERFDSINERFDKFEAENKAAHEAIISRIDAQSELLEARVDVLNERLFDQETQLKILRKKEVVSLAP